MCIIMFGRVEGGDFLNKIEVMWLVYNYKKCLGK